MNESTSVATLTCNICPRGCKLQEGATGFCKTRKNEGGNNRPLNYGRFTSIGLDPIEKKPLYRFRSGQTILSVGSFGCNLTCPFCQNHEISCADASILTRQASPEELLLTAMSLQSQNNIGIAFTYNEPILNVEFIKETAALFHARGLSVVLVTNGYATQPIWEELLAVTDALNIDLKAFTEEGYAFCGGELETVKRSIRLAVKAKHVHLEVTSLIVPGLNDHPAMMEQQCAWLASLSPEIPLHITRFFPQHKMRDKEPTPIPVMETLFAIAKQYLQYVYLGNI